MAGMSRLQVLANGWLKEVHRGACKLAVVDRRFAATTVVQMSTLTDSRRPIGVIPVTVFLTLKESIGFDQVDVWSSFIHE
jgi:hypothetical protein